MENDSAHNSHEKEKVECLEEVIVLEGLLDL